MYSLRKEKNELILLNEGNPCLCPHQSKVLVPGSVAGTLSLQEFNCSSRCALFDYTQSLNNVKLHCGNKSINDIVVEPDKTIHLFSNGMGNA